MIRIPTATTVGKNSSPRFCTPAAQRPKHMSFYDTETECHSDRPSEKPVVSPHVTKICGSVGFLFEKHTKIAPTHLSMAISTFTLISISTGMVWSSHITYSKSHDLPGKVANPPRGQLNRENQISLSPFGEFGLARRVRQSRPASACSSPFSG